MGANAQHQPIPAPSARPRQKRGLVPPEVGDLVGPPLRVGVWSGAAGALTGVGVAIIRDTNPVISGAVSGTQLFALGAGFWFTRTVAIRSWGGAEQLRPVDKVMASTMAGGVAGAAPGLMRGPSHILPAMAFWAVVGAGGQVVANSLEARQRKAKAKGTKNSWHWTKLLPLRNLTDQEYVDMIGDKILQVEASIALINDKIAELRVAEQKAKDQGAASSK